MNEATTESCSSRAAALPWADDKEVEEVEDSPKSVKDVLERVPPSMLPVEIDPSLFVLSEQEKEWALAIKDAIEGLPDVDNLSDFMYAHMGIAGKGDLEWAVDRAYKMQEVRQEYKIAMTYEEGARLLRDFRNSYPTWMLSYSFDPKTGKVVQVMDITNPEFAKTWLVPKNDELIIRAITYICYANYPSFECVRVGNVHIFECEGHNWAKLGMKDSQQFFKVTDLTMGTFPSVLHTKFYNTSVMVNIALSMAKRVIPKEVHSKWEVGGKFPGGRLDKFYMLPTPEIASHRTIDNFCKALKFRLESEKQFSLDD